MRYLADLVDRAPPAARAADYGRAIYDLALRRELIRIGGDIADDRQGRRPGDHRARPDRGGRAAALHPGRDRRLVDRPRRPRRRAGLGAVEMAAEAYNRDGGLSGLSTGLSDLDAKLGGLHPSDLLILAARPSMGKSSLAANIAFNVAAPLRLGAAAGRHPQDRQRRGRRLLLAGNVGARRWPCACWPRSAACRRTRSARARSAPASSARSATRPPRSRRRRSTSTTPAASRSPSWWRAPGA